MNGRIGAFGQETRVSTQGLGFVSRAFVPLSLLLPLLRLFGFWMAEVAKDDKAECAINVTSK